MRFRIWQWSVFQFWLVFSGNKRRGLGFNNEVNMKEEWFIGVPLKTMNLVSWACESASCWEPKWRKNPNWRQNWEWRVKSESERESFGYIYIRRLFEVWRSSWPLRLFGTFRLYHSEWQSESGEAGICAKWNLGPTQLVGSN